MSRFVALVTVDDPGAAEVIAESLATRGIECQIARVPTENPYLRTALESLRILVPEERFDEARGALEALETDVERDFPAQASADAPAAPEDDGAPELKKRAGRRVSFATLWLAFAVPAPIITLLAGAREVGLAFLGVFLGLLAKVVTYERGTAPKAILLLLLGVKAVDLVVGLAIALSAPRKRRPPAR